MTTIRHQVTNHGPTTITVICRDGAEVALEPDASTVCDAVRIDCSEGPAHWSLGPPDDELRARLS